MWCLGNEMDGPWQLGAKSAHEYGRLAEETARAMRRMQPDLELVACGSSSSAMPTFGQWERTVLSHAYDQVDLISAHAYYFEEDGDLGSFLASAVDMDHFIDSVVAAADLVRAERRATKRVHISLDEWNVWYQRRAESRPPTGDEWPVGPVLLEDRYNVADAVVVGNLLISLLRHTDRVHAASLAQLVNVIAPTMTEPGGRAWRQTIFHPFAQASAHASGEVLRVEIDAPSYETARFGPVQSVDAVATYDSDAGALTVFAVNRSTTSPVIVEGDLRGFGPMRVAGATSLSNPDHTWFATVNDDASVRPRSHSDAAVSDGRLSAPLPPVSWNVIRLERA